MLARNEDREEAVKSILSLEERFNRWYNYPVVFLNDEPFDQSFVDALSAAISGEATFETIAPESWTFPDWIDSDKAKASIKAQGERKIIKAGIESYHHMCRFYSGKFYDHPALQKYKWYWRIEPSVSYTCSITYDPFVEMAKRNMKYGYTTALWEVGNTSPGLFRAVADFKRSKSIPSTTLWSSMVDPSWLPYPLRKTLAKLVNHRNEDGDQWNFCHFWSNFEIADLEFYRSAEYREFFEYLDRKGGFYFERWGDAPVHSFAAALFLRPEQVHHFADFGYYHPPLHVSPSNALGGQGRDSVLLGKGSWAPEVEGGVGCRCSMDLSGQTQNFDTTCIAKLTRAMRATG